MPGPLHINNRYEIPEAELSWRFSRSSGPGGQSVNTADSRVELSFDISASPTLPQFMKDRAIERLSNRLVDGVITVAASEARSQFGNRVAAERRLTQVLADAFAPPKPPRRATKPSKSAQRKRVDTKKQRGEVKRGRQKPTSDD